MFNTNQSIESMDREEVFKGLLLADQTCCINAISRLRRGKLYSEYINNLIKPAADNSIAIFIEDARIRYSLLPENLKCIPFNMVKEHTDYLITEHNKILDAMSNYVNR